MSERPTKTCVLCGREIQWRKKWERDWDGVKYCSKSCRSRGVSPTDESLEASILELLGQRSAGSSICPSEAARAVHDDRSNPEGWRDLMEPARMAARRLADRGLAEITQKGRPVDPSTARGPIRIRLSAKGNHA